MQTAHHSEEKQMHRIINIIIAIIEGNIECSSCQVQYLPCTFELEFASVAAAA